MQHPSSRHPLRRFGARVPAALLIWALARSASALEVTAGDYEAFPAGSNIAMMYLQYAQRSDSFANGNKLSSNFDMNSSVALARFIHVVKLSDNAVLDPQFILPFGQLRTGGDASVLGNASGTGDLIVGAPVKYVLDQNTRDVISIGPYLYLPTGSYDSNKLLNLGENRWKALVQLAYIRHFNAQWALDLVGDVTVHGDNTNYTPAHATLKQAARYEVQAHLRYNLSQATALSAGVGSIHGGQTKVNGVDQNDRINTQYARLTVTSFITPTVQWQVQYGRDLSVENGLKEKNRINLRLAKLF
ncbi:transporter [Herbaspirillum sp. alder98]|uniref:transporter n=1 Tax=Herbaspirillum sp. alder98 TaxID=2913096 RepID=UPI001CD832FC|nr:transporter [Herbaspirillum sp. alder98]MCA1325193.1 transporter [Herbaspirillum sp. alder98]